MGTGTRGACPGSRRRRIAPVTPPTSVTMPERMPMIAASVCRSMAPPSLAEQQRAISRFLPDRIARTCPVVNISWEMSVRAGAMRVSGRMWYTRSGRRGLRGLRSLLRRDIRDGEHLDEGEAAVVGGAEPAAKDDAGESIGGDAGGMLANDIQHGGTALLVVDA